MAGADGRKGALLSLAASAVLFLAFFGVLLVNEVVDGPYRAYDWFARERITLEEAVLFAGIVFLATPAALLLGRAALPWAAGATLRLARTTVRRAGITLVGAMVVALGLAAGAGVLLVQHSPLTDEEQALLFQADLLRHRRLETPAPPHLAELEPPGIWVRDGKWTGNEQWGHAAVLAVGETVGAPYAGPHLVAPLLVLLTFLLCRELFPSDRAARVGAMLLVATSPFVVFTTGALGPASTSAAAVMLGAFTLARHVRRGGAAWAVLAGLAFGFDLHVRPINGATVGGLCAGLAIVAERRRPWPLIVGLTLGLAPWVALHMTLGRMGFTTGTPSLPMSPTLYTFGRGVSDLLRFVLWSSGSALVAVAVPAAASGLRRHATDWLLLTPVLALFAVHVGYLHGPEGDTGPATYLDVLPFFAIFVARVVTAAHARLSEGGRAALAVGVAAAVLAALGTWWPVQALGLRTSASSVRAPYQLVEKIDMPRAIVLWSTADPPRSWVTTPRAPSLNASEQVLFVRRQETPWMVKTFTKGRSVQGRRAFEIVQSLGEPGLVGWKPPAGTLQHGPRSVETLQSREEELSSPALD